MQLHLSSWPEVEAYLATSKAILIPIGSTEQHGPNGLLGTDALCPEIIAKRAGDESGILVGPTFNVGIAQHHMAFPGTITLRWVGRRRLPGLDCGRAVRVEGTVLDQHGLFVLLNPLYRFCGPVSTPNG